MQASFWHSSCDEHSTITIHERDAYVASGEEAKVAYYTLEATSGGGIVRMKSPLTASEAYARTVALRRQGFTDIVAINSTTGRRITEVKRLLRDV